MLTPAQKNILIFVIDHINREGFPPTFVEVMDGIGYASVNSVQEHFEALERKGYISRTPGKSRAIRVTRKP